MKFYNKRSASKFGSKRIEVTLDGLGKSQHGLTVWGEDSNEYFFEFYSKAFVSKVDFKAAKKARAAQRQMTDKSPWPSSEGRLLRQSRQGWHYKERSCA